MGLANDWTSPNLTLNIDVKLFELHGNFRNTFSSLIDHLQLMIVAVNLNIMVHVYNFGFRHFWYYLGCIMKKRWEAPLHFKKAPSISKKAPASAWKIGQMAP